MEQVARCRYRLRRLRRRRQMSLSLSLRLGRHQEWLDRQAQLKVVPVQEQDR
jgi:hypothetical protein